MASTPVEIQLPSGVTATLSLYPLDSDTLANSDGADTLTEATNAKGFYTATVTEALEGIYRVKVLVGSTVLASGFVRLYDDATTYRVIDDYLWASGPSTTPIVPSPSPAGFSTGYTYVYDELGAVESGVALTLQCVGVPSGGGLVLDGKTRTATSDGDGYAEFTNLIRGAKYRIYRSSSSNAASFPCPTDATFELANFLGSD